jgi:hypothetical protein
MSTGTDQSGRDAAAKPSARTRHDRCGAGDIEFRHIR